MDGLRQDNYSDRCKTKMENEESGRLDGYANTKLNLKLRQYYDGKIVRKDLTKHIKEGANVPVYVLEYLLGQYCNSEDEQIISEGVENVKRILANNYVRPDEAQKVLSRLRKNGNYTVIDMVTARLDMKRNLYVAAFSNLGITMFFWTMNIRRSMIVFCAAVFGALFSWITNTLRKKRKTACRFKYGS